MPIYAFECAACGHEFERLQRLADADPLHCPVCGAEQIRRQLTAPSFRLAGAGWYETDFKKDGDKKRNLAEKPEPAGASSKSEPATPAAPATKSEPVTKSEPATPPKAVEKPKPAAE